jgi:hypothetical protein
MKEINSYNILVSKPEKNRSLSRREVDGKVILKLIIKGWNVWNSFRFLYWQLQVKKTAIKSQ